MPSYPLSININAKNNATGAFNKIQGQLGKLTSSLKSSSVLGSIGFSQVANSVSALGAGIGEFNNQVLHVSADFRRQMAVVKAISGSSEKDFETLTAKAEELGRTTEFTGKEAGEGMEKLARSGLGVKRILSDITPILNLATVEGHGLAETATLVTSAMNTFGEKAGNAVRVTDLLHGASKSANVNLTTLTETLKFAAPIASAAGASFEEVLALTGGLGNVGLQGSIAGTGLKNFYNTISSNLGQKKLGNLGIDVKGKGTFEVLEQVQEKLNSLTDKRDRLSLLTDVFGKIGSGAVAKLAGNFGSVVDVFKKISSSGGAVKTTLAEIEKTTAFKIKSMSSAADGLKIALGSTAKGFSDLGLEIKTALLTATTWLVNTIPGFGKVFSLASQALGAIASLSAPMFHMISVLNLLGQAQTYTAIKSVFAAVKIGIFATASKVATAATWLFNSALLANPIILITLAVIAAITAVVLLVVYFKEVVNVLSLAWSWIVQTGESLIEFINPISLVISATNILANAWKSVTSAISEAWQWIKNVAGDNAVVSFLSNLVGSGDDSGDTQAVRASANQTITKNSETKNKLKIDVNAPAGTSVTGDSGENIDISQGVSMAY